jgi:Fe-S-cluster containining protein
LSSAEKKLPGGEPLAELERQVAQGGLHTHSALSRHAARLNRIEAFVYGLADALLDKGSIGEEELRTRADRVAAELRENKETVSAGIVLRVDAEQPPADATVDCAARMHVCHAVCCRLSFALSASEVEQGKVRWELGRPYLNRKDATGACIHLDHNCNGCDVYADRPRVCRSYSCAGDARIWNDFDAMILNQEWIDENLKPERPHLIVARMEPVD